MTGSPVPGLSASNWAEFEKRAVTPEIAIKVGVRDCAEWPGPIIPYLPADGGTPVPVYRLTQAERDARTDGQRYRFQKGATPPISVVLERGDGGPVALVEGSIQPLAVASWAPEGLSTHGMNGKDGWTNDDLTRYDGREVLVWLDADVTSKRDVHDAAEALAEKLTTCGATVRHIIMPARGSTGADDFLAEIKDVAKRTDVIRRLVDKAGALPRKPRAKKKPKPGTAALFFHPVDGGFLAESGTLVVLADAPAALTREGLIACYVDGVFKIDGTQFSRTVSRLMREEFRLFYEKQIEAFARGLLHDEGKVLPEQADEPIVNLANGMLDLRSGELLPHDPSYLSGIQLPVEFDPEARCPVYDLWIEAVCPGQGEDLDEVCSQMIDPSRTPTKAPFHYGPSRSGKSTHLRLLEAIAGEHRSAVTLHQLASNRFVAAAVYGAVLNAAADLSAKHVEDLSLFKMLTGEDSIQADRKYGKLFKFRNQAMFAFSANEPPTVSDSSRAYAERIKPFRFDRSFAGREDPSIEDRMRGELPGIFNRLLAGWQRRMARGGFQESNPEVRQDFESRSHRVLRWLAERGRVTVRPDGSAPTDGCTLPEDRVTAPRFLAKMFDDWAQEQGGSTMGEQKIKDILTSVKGVVQVRNPNKIRGLNITATPVGVELPEEEGAESAILPTPSLGMVKLQGQQGDSFIVAREGMGNFADSAPATDPELDALWADDEESA